MKYNKELREFAKVTYHILDNTDDIEVINAIKAMLFPIHELIDKEVADDLGLELWLWVGLKEDSSEMAKDYGKGIMDSYAEYLG